MTLAARLAEIYVDVQRFTKSKQITGQGPSFSYTPIEEIVDELRAEMGKRGIVMVPSRCDVVASEDAGVTKSGTTRWRHIVKVTWTLTDGESVLEVESVGEAMDTGDKGMNKAQTAARKYALIGAFQLSTGDDTDRRHPEPAARPQRAANGAGSITDAQRKRMFAIAKTAGIADAVLRAVIREERGDGVESTQGMSRDVYDRVIARLEAAS